MEENEFLTAAEVAAHLGISKMTVTRMIHRGDLPAIRAGRNFRIAKAEYEAFLKRGGSGRGA